jgi:hypothetical protein
MRLAVYNVENLFDRPRAMNLDTWTEGKPILQRFAALPELLGEANYTAARKAKMAKLTVEQALKSGTTDVSSSSAETRGSCCADRKPAGSS